MKFSNVDKFVLFGGGFLLYYFSKILTDNKINHDLIIGPRHQKEIVAENKTLIKLLGKNKNIFKITNLTSEFLKKYKKDKKTVFVSFSSPWIFKNKDIKEIFKNKLINSHGSRLPQNRGGGGFSWRILCQNKLGYCALHHVDSKVDTGKILLIEEFTFPYKLCRPHEYISFQNEQEKIFLNKFLKKIQRKEIFKTIDQPEYLSSYFPRLSTDDNGWIDWSYKINDLFNFICAFDEPFDGASTYYKNQIVKIKNVNLTKSDQPFHPFQYGLIYRKTEKFALVACKEGSLIVSKIFNTKGKNIFNNLKVGDRFFTPLIKLDSAKKRFYFNSKGKKI